MFKVGDRVRRTMHPMTPGTVTKVGLKTTGGIDYVLVRMDDMPKGEIPRRVSELELCEGQINEWETINGND